MHDVANTRALLFTPRCGSSRDLITQLETQGIQVAELPLDSHAGHSTLRSRPDLVLIESSGEACGRWQNLAREVRRIHSDVPLVLLTAGGSEDLAISALRLGVRDYLHLPISSAALAEAVDRCLGRTSPFAKRYDVEVECVSDDMVGSSEVLCRIKSYMKRAAGSDCTVLITGETGTGKELAAEFIHKHSPRRNKPFVCVNCAAIPEPLFESELFGHVRGAFTGADNVRDGLLLAADGGTVLLDEIGDMSLSAQAKILRVLEKREVVRLGATQQRKVDIRFVAATNQDLESMTDRGTFRRDLFYRLNVARVELPPLRERKGDIPLLVEHYRRRLGGEDVADISEECMQRISQHNWPGNIRELKNVVESIFLNCACGEVHAEDLPKGLRETVHKEPTLPPDERAQLVEALCATQWNKSRAAEKLNWSRMTLYRKMAKYRLSEFPAAGGL